MMLAHVRARPRDTGKVTPAQTHKAARRSSTSATKSLCEHDCERSRTPRTTITVARNRSSGRGWLLRKTLPFGRAPQAANRDVTGQGSRSRRYRLIDFDTSRRDRSRRELCPAPLGSSTSCRSFVVGGLGAIPVRTLDAVAGVARNHLDRARLSAQPERERKRTPSSGGPEARPREGSHLEIVPEVPSVVRRPLGVCVVHSLSPACGFLLVPFQSPRSGSLTR